MLSLAIVVVRLVVDRVLALAVQREGDVDGQLRGVAGAGARAAGAARGAGGVAVRADQPERDADLAAGVDQAADLGPDVVAEPDKAAVQRVHAVVDRQRVGLAVQLEGALGDPVGVTADRLTEVRAAVGGHRRAVIGHVVLQRLEAEHHVRGLAVLARHVDRLGDRAEGQELDRHAPAVGQRVAVRRRHLAGVRLRRAPEELLGDAQGGAVPGLRLGRGRLRGRRRGDGRHPDS